jgi:hypothetical protein
VQTAQPAIEPEGFSRLAPALVKDATAGERGVLIYLPLALCGVLTAVSAGVGGSEWFEYGWTALVGSLLVFFVPAYLIYRFAVRRVRRLFDLGRPGQASVVASGARGRGIYTVALELVVADRRVGASVQMTSPPELSAGDRVDVIVGRPRRGRGMFCALIPGVGAEIGRYRLVD